MICYIKNRMTFNTYGIYTVTEYDDIYFGTALGDKSRIKLPTRDDIARGDIIYCDNGFIGKIESIKYDPTKSIAVLTCAEAMDLLDIEYGWYNALYTNTINTLLEVVKTWDVESGGMPYLRYSAGDWYSVPSFTPYVDDISRFSISEYLKACRLESKLNFDFKINRFAGQDILKITVGHRIEETRKIDFSNRDFVLLQESYSGEPPSVVLCIVDNRPMEPYFTYTYWYVKTDGTVTTSEPAAEDRVRGKLISKKVEPDDDQEAIVLAEIEKTKYTHKIKFSCSKEYNLFDRTQIRLNGKILESYISSVSLKGKSNKHYYTTGDLKTSLTEILGG